jgi:hypothetical protein
MTATTKWIEDAIAGGWLYKGTKHLYDRHTDNDVVLRLKGSANRFEVALECLLLDPLAWQAVGRTRGWTWGDGVTEPIEPNWNHEWHRFIDRLADGLSIEDALKAIE